MTIKVLDLFSGIGGFSLGFHRAQMKTVAFCEIDPHARNVLKKNFPNIPILEDVKTLTLKELESRNLPKIDLICGGFPCQDISTAGKQKGFIDAQGNPTRSGLWFEYKRIIKEVKPKYVVIENVANLRSKGLGRVLKDLWELGYDAEWHVISAKSCGAWHERKRIWIIAFPHGHNFRLCPETVTTKEEKQKWWTETTTKLSHRFSVEPSFCGGTNGFSGKLDEPRKRRIRQLGNAVVPQIPELIGGAIMEHENNLKVTNGKMST